MQYTALPTDIVRALQAGGPDAHGNPPERTVSDGAGTPCRHCLCDVPAGDGMLVLAHRPFKGLHPYAETGPIFLCAAACIRADGAEAPPVLATSPDYLLKAYGDDERIIYGTGAVVAAKDVAARARVLLGDTDVAFVDVRSARNTCFLLRIDRGQQRPCPGGAHWP